MKNKSLLILSFLSLVFLNLNSQEIDKSFLESLPANIRADVLNKASQQSDVSQTNYRSSEFSTRLEFEDNIIALRERLEEDLEKLEARLSSDEQLSYNENDVFGSLFFNTFQTSFMPINEPNPDSSYTLDVGDTLKIQLIGQKDIIDLYPIDADGSINIPDIGKLTIAGLKLDEAYSFIKAKVDKIFIGTEAYITLEKIRDVNILVSGNAKNPGVYTLTGNSNLLHALTMAGGVNEFGSYREINLIRDQKTIETLDIYELLINGKYKLDKRLRTGDVIFVESRKNVVSIYGAVKRPAKYELNDKQSLHSLIEYSYGLTKKADLRNIYLERILDGNLKSIPIVNISQFKDIQPMDGDMIYVREHPYRTAEISGAVVKPGTYLVTAGETFSDLIRKAGGYTENAYPFGAVFINQDAAKINSQAKGKLYDEFIDNIVAMSEQSIGQNIDLSVVLSLAEGIKDAQPNGRIVVDLTSGNYGNLIKIKPGDSVTIPEKTNNVYVYGEVSVEGAVIYESNKNLEHFILKSGGYNKFADLESIYILHPNGETQKFSQRRNIFESEPSSNITIYPGSVIFVPRKLDTSASRRLATQAYVSILGNIGIALASLSSIKNN